MIGCLLLIGGALAGLAYLWLHDWETPETLDMKVQERKRKE